MDFDRICRTCLGEKSLKPIFKNREHHERFSMAMWNTTGLRVELDDGLPQNICIDCMVLVNKSLKFRAVCKEVEMKLLKMRTDYDESTESAFSDCDASKDNINKDVPDDSSDEEKPMDTFDVSYTDSCSQPLEKIVTKTGTKHITIFKDTTLNNHKKQVEDNDYNTCHEYLTEIGSEVVCEIDNDVDRDVDIDRITCDVCEKSLTLNAFNTHLKYEHREIPTKKVKCQLCDCYVGDLKLNWHTVVVHGRNSSICKFCKFDHYSMESLLEHQKLCEFRKNPVRPHYGDNKKMGECDICHKKMQKSSIKMHQKIKHAGLGPVCDVSTDDSETKRNKRKLSQTVKSTEQIPLPSGVSYSSEFFKFCKKL